VVGHFGDNITPMRELIYGVGNPLDNEDHYLNVYEQHNKEILSHFQD